MYEMKYMRMMAFICEVKKILLDDTQDDKGKVGAFEWCVEKYGFKDPPEEKK